jgi:AcrR family transcriptional regulator
MDKINTKSKIKSIALNLFNRMGTLSVSLNTIAKEVGISPGNLRYHYKTREEIILDLYYDMQTKIESLNSFEAILTADNPLKIMVLYLISMAKYFGSIDLYERCICFNNFRPCIKINFSHQS